MTFTPNNLVANRTARLVREAKTPVFSTVTPTPESRRVERLRHLDTFAGEDFCHICGRCTDHRGEHSDEQLFAWAKTPRGKWLLS